MNWFTETYRRNLVDMHIEDWNPEFLSQFSPEEYYQNLVIGKIQAPMIYLQSHVGHCYFPTKTGHMHNALIGRENLIKRLIDMCRRNGMHVIGYYSLIFNKWALEQHPDWMIHNGDGISSRAKKNRHGLCCPNNIEYREFTFAQIREIAEYFELDGMFYDMLFWPDICRCDSCQKRYANETGGKIPERMDWNDSNWVKFQRKREEWMGEFAMTVANETKRLMPHVSVEHNYACAVAGDWSNASTELVNESCDYAGGDLYGDLYNHSFTCKYYMNITKNPPFEYMTCRCDSSLIQHTVTKSEEKLTTEIMLTAAHHGASFIIDAIDPRGTLDRRVYDRIGKVFAKHIEYEPYFKGNHIADIAVFYSTSGRYNSNGYPFNSKTTSIETVKTMIERHIPISVISNGCIDRISEYKFVLAPALAGMSEKNIDKLISYVHNGGNLYISGVEEKRLLTELTGAVYTGMTQESRTYISPKKEYETLFGEFNSDYPMPVDYKLPIVNTNDNESVIALITLPYTDPAEQKFASIHSNPPGIVTAHPALIIKKYGSGNVIWSAAPIEFDSRNHYKDLLMNLIHKYVSKSSLTFQTDASKKIELVVFKNDKNFLISAIDLDAINEVTERTSFTIKLKTNIKPSSVVKLPDNKPIDFIYSDGYVTFKTDILKIFDMYSVNF